MNTILEATKLLADDHKILQNMPDNIPLIIVLNKVDKIQLFTKRRQCIKWLRSRSLNLLRLFHFSKKYQIDIL